RVGQSVQHIENVQIARCRVAELGAPALGPGHRLPFMFDVHSTSDLRCSSYYKRRMQEPLMRAVVMSEPSPGPDRTEVRTIDPPHPGPGQIGIDVQFAGINFIEAMPRGGGPGYASPGPCVPGLEYAGPVRACGHGVTAAVPGQRVAA